MSDKEALIKTIEYLWCIIDDIGTYGDMAKSNDKLFRELTEKRQKDRWKTGIEIIDDKLDMSELKL